MKKVISFIFLITASATHAQEYTSDNLGNGFMQKTLTFPNDYEGKVTATLVAKKSGNATDKAVLFIHGFNDYFFQHAMADSFIRHGIDFYALDLRKYGRSYLPHQKFNNVRRLQEYDAEILSAMHIIEMEKHSKVLLAGHSTGGLIATGFVARNPGTIVKAVFLNSPFFDFNMGLLADKMGVPILSGLGAIFPNMKIPGGFSNLYGQSLYYKDKGEWQYNLNWKPHIAPKVNLGFVRAIHRAQKLVKKGFVTNVPFLVMHSARSTKPGSWNKDVSSTDVILDVKDISKYADCIHGPITKISVNRAIHDLVLSGESVRKEVYRLLFEWLGKNFKD